MCIGCFHQITRYNRILRTVLRHEDAIRMFKAAEVPFIESGSISIGKMNRSLSDRRRWDGGLLQMITYSIQSIREFQIIPCISIAAKDSCHGNRPNIDSDANISNSAMISSRK